MALENDAFLWELLHETPGEIYDVDEEEKFNVESYINGDTDYWYKPPLTVLLMFPEMFDFETNYYWGELVVRMVPMFGFKKYKANEDELLWVYDVNSTDRSFYVPARNLSTYKYWNCFALKCYSGRLPVDSRRGGTQNGHCPQNLLI